MSESNYYVDLSEFPLYNWEKCQDGNLEFMRMPNCDVTKCNTEADNKAWELMQYDYIERFGVSSKHARYSTLQRDLLVLKLEKVATGDKFLDNQIEDIQEELDKLFKRDSMEKNIVDKSLIHMNAKFKCGLNKKEIMTLQYFLMAKEYGKAN